MCARGRLDSARSTARATAARTLQDFIPMTALPEHPWGQVFTLPNLLTVARVPLAAVLWLAPGDAMFLLAVVATAAGTDMLDGRVARALRARRVARGQDPAGLGEAQAVGAWLDPLCDKIFVISAVGAIYVGWRPPLAVVALIATRELVMTPLMVIYALASKRVRRRPLDLRAGPAGKATTVAQFLAMGSVIVAPAATWPLAALACIAGLITTARYTRRGLASLDVGDA